MISFRINKLKNLVDLQYQYKIIIGLLVFLNIKISFSSGHYYEKVKSLKQKTRSACLPMRCASINILTILKYNCIGPTDKLQVQQYQRM